MNLILSHTGTHPGADFQGNGHHSIYLLSNASNLAVHSRCSLPNKLSWTALV